MKFRKLLYRTNLGKNCVLVNSRVKCSHMTTKVIIDATDCRIVVTYQSYSDLGTLENYEP